MSSRDLVRMRNTAETTFDRVVEVWRSEAAADGAGGWTLTPARQSSGPGRLAPVLDSVDSLRDRGNRVAGAEEWVVTLPVGRDIRLTDELRIDGRRFAISGTDEGRSLGVTLRLNVTEVT